MEKANPTIRIQNRIIEVIKKSKRPMSITAIAKKANTGFNETKRSIDFLYKLKVIDLVISSGNSTIVILKRGEQNATT